MYFLFYFDLLATQCSPPALHLFVAHPTSILFSPSLRIRELGLLFHLSPVEPHMLPSIAAISNQWLSSVNGLCSRAEV